MIDSLNSTNVSSMVANADATNSNLNYTMTPDKIASVGEATTTREVKQSLAMRAIYYSMGDEESASNFLSNVNDEDLDDLASMFENMDKSDRMELKNKISDALENRQNQILSDAQAAMISGGKSSNAFSDFSSFFIELQNSYNESSGSNLDITTSDLSSAFESLNEKYNQNLFDKMI